ncbi:MAG: cytochrome c biogenesis protein ResB [Deltaproteobacteria bacterium]|nr:cytochrome c biogenesis protein ResB [Deltaproteobacteria bacterium]
MDSENHQTPKARPKALPETQSEVRVKIRKIIKALASLKLAVVIIVMIGIVTAWGTIVEAQFDALAAKKLVYDSIWMWVPMVLLVISLTAVMIDRWPWQKRHTGFVLAHIGIIILLLGSLITQRFGVDGSISFGIGEKQKNIIVGETDLAVYSSFDGAQYAKLFDREVDFLKRPAGKIPIVIPIPEGEIKIVESLPYAIREQKFVEAEPDSKAGAAIRFQMQNPNVNITEWMLQPSKDGVETKDLGPAQVLIVSQFPRDFGGRNAIIFKPLDDERLEFNVHTARRPGIQKGTVKAGESIKTGWMGLELRMLKYLPRAKEDITYRALEKPTPMTSAAIKVAYRAPGKKEVSHQWMGLNSLLKLFSDGQVYVVSYANRRIPLGFDLSLKDFRIGRYQGTLRAASYESVVTLPDATEHLISMNEPLKHASFTFYQASFESDPSGRPVASILSVNRDPGRGLKYFGSLLLVFGAIHLFYMKRRAWLKKPAGS